MTRTSKSILCLWVGCAIMAVCCTCQIGVLYAVHFGLLDPDPSIQEGFALLIPMLLGFAVAALGATVAIAGLCVSWRWNRQPLFSWPHIPMLLFVLPLTLAWFYWSRAA